MNVTAYVHFSCLRPNGSKDSFVTRSAPLRKRRVSRISKKTVTGPHGRKYQYTRYYVKIQGTEYSLYRFRTYHTELKKFIRHYCTHAGYEVCLESTRESVQVVTLGGYTWDRKQVQAMHAALCSWLNGTARIPYSTTGICVNLRFIARAYSTTGGLLDEYKFKHTLYALFESWPGYSGNKKFPVRAVGYRSPEGTYSLSIGSMYDPSTPYGRSRLSLMRHMTAELEKALSGGKE